MPCSVRCSGYNGKQETQLLSTWSLQLNRREIRKNLVNMSNHRLSRLLMIPSSDWTMLSALIGSIRPKVKAQYYMCLDIWGKVGGHWMADLQVPLPTPLLRMGSPSPTSSLSWGPATMPIYPCMAGCGSLPAYRIVQASQSHPPLGTSGTLALLLLQSLPRTASGCLLCSRLQLPCGPAGHSVLFSWAGVNVTNKGGNPTLTDGVKSRWSKQRYFRHRVKTQFLSMSTHCREWRREWHFGHGRYKRRLLLEVAEHQTQNKGNFMLLSTFPLNLIFPYSEMAQR